VGTFLAEGYLAAGTAERLRQFRTAAARASRDMARDGISVAYLSSVFLPADQTCLGLFQASDPEHVSEACRRAGIPCDRITEAILGPRAADTAPLPDKGEINEGPS
jgi:uncharacterized protein DUF4242